MGHTWPMDRRDTCVVLADQNVGNALGAVRQLGKRGVRVFLAGPRNTVRAAGASRLCLGSAVIDLDEPSALPGQLTALLRSWAVDPDDPVTVLPLSDRLVELLNSARQGLPGNVRPVLSNPSVTRALIAKDASMRIAERAGLSVPAWRRVTVSGRDTIEPGFNFPAIVKPLAWSTRGEHPFKLQVVHDRAELDAFLDQVVGAGAGVVVQEYIAAPEEACEFGLVWRSMDGESSVVCTGMKTRHSHPDGGVLAFGVSVQLPDVRQATMNFVTEADFVGVGGIEFIRRDGKLWFVEFNPRPEAFHALAELAGHPLAWYAHHEFLGGEVTPAPDTERAAIWVGSAWLSRVRHSPGSLRLLLTDHAAFRAVTRRVYAVWDVRDLRPWLAVVVGLLAAAGRKVLKRPRAVRVRKGPGA